MTMPWQLTNDNKIGIFIVIDIFDKIGHSNQIITFLYRVAHVNLNTYKVYSVRTFFDLIIFKK